MNKTPVEDPNSGRIFFSCDNINIITDAAVESRVAKITADFETKIAPLVNLSLGKGPYKVH